MGMQNVHIMREVEMRSRAAGVRSFKWKCKKNNALTKYSVEIFKSNFHPNTRTEEENTYFKSLFLQAQNQWGTVNSHIFPVTSAWHYFPRWRWHLVFEQWAWTNPVNLTQTGVLFPGRAVSKFCPLHRRSCHFDSFVTRGRLEQSNPRSNPQHRAHTQTRSEGTKPEKKIVPLSNQKVKYFICPFELLLRALKLLDGVISFVCQGKECEWKRTVDLYRDRP